MKRGRHAASYGHVELRRKLEAVASAEFEANQDAKRCKTPFCGALGECLACGADQGVYCRADLIGMSRTETAQQRLMPTETNVNEQWT